MTVDHSYQANPATILDASSLLAIPGERRSVQWEDDAARLFERRMLNTSDLFPCVFGVDAVRRRTLRYCFVPFADRVETLRRGLREFAERCYDFGKRTSLVTFFESDPELTKVEDYQREFWHLLRSLSEADDQPWPPEIEKDTESPFWEFSCFGVPFFVVANTPCHHARRSRYFEYFAITFQPRFVFDDLGADTTTGRNARKVIRQRLRHYDSVPPYGGLGNFGDADNREWVQYFLPDNDDDIPPPSQKCPLSNLRDGKEMLDHDQS